MLPRGAARFVATVLAAVLGAAMLGACASTPEVDDLDLRLEAADHAFGRGYEYLMVHSAGRTADGAFISLSRATGSSELARELGARLAPAASGSEVRMLVTGPAGEKNVQVISDALDTVAARPLPALELLYLGLPADGESVRAVAERAGAYYRFAPYAE